MEVQYLNVNFNINYYISCLKSIGLILKTYRMIIVLCYRPDIDSATEVSYKGIFLFQFEILISNKQYNTMRGRGLKTYVSS